MTGGARRIATPDGVNLALHRLRAYRDGRPATLLVHGAFTNHRFWLHSADNTGGMAHFLGAAGLAVWLADLRHHGESAREPRRGAWTFEDWVLRDAPALVTRVREETDGAPLAWLGHSAGGAAGLCWLARVAAPDARRHDHRRLAGTRPIPARALRFGNEDEAAEIIAEWMEWNVRGAWLGTDSFDYFAAWQRWARRTLASPAAPTGSSRPQRPAARWSNGWGPLVRPWRSSRVYRIADSS